MCHATGPGGAQATGDRSSHGRHYTPIAIVTNVHAGMWPCTLCEVWCWHISMLQLSLTSILRFVLHSYGTVLTTYIATESSTKYMYTD